MLSVVYAKCHLCCVSLILSVTCDTCMLSTKMMNVFMLNVIVLSGVILNVVAPLKLKTYFISFILFLHLPTLGQTNESKS
jgi:hypothetical protein